MSLYINNLTFWPKIAPVTKYVTSCLFLSLTSCLQPAYGHFSLAQVEPDHLAVVAGFSCFSCPEPGQVEPSEAENRSGADRNEEKNGRQGERGDDHVADVVALALAGVFIPGDVGVVVHAGENSVGVAARDVAANQCDDRTAAFCGAGASAEGRSQLLEGGQLVDGNVRRGIGNQQDLRLSREPLR